MFAEKQHQQDIYSYIRGFIWQVACSIMEVEDSARDTQESHGVIQCVWRPENLGYWLCHPNQSRRWLVRNGCWVDLTPEVLVRQSQESSSIDKKHCSPRENTLVFSAFWFYPVPLWSGWHLSLLAGSRFLFLVCWFWYQALFNILRDRPGNTVFLWISISTVRWTQR